MAKDIIKMLSKKGKLTGAEVGNLILKDTIHGLLHPTEKELISEAEARTAVNSLTDNYEIETYNKRCAIGSFICGIWEKIIYADLLLNKKFMDILVIADRAKEAVEFLHMPKPKRLTYEQYEAYKKEKLAEYFKENGKRTLFDLILIEIQDLFNTDDGEAKVEAYRNQRLEEDEIAFYGGETTEERFCDWTKKGEESKELIQQGKYKEAIACYLSGKHSYKRTRTYDKADLAYDLAEYWQESDKTEETFNKISSYFKDLLLFSLEAVNKKYFEGTLSDIKLEDTLKKQYTLKELYEVYNYKALPHALNNELILISTYGIEDTAEERAREHTEAFMKVFDNPDMFKTSLEAFEESIIALDNINTLLDLLQQETGVNEIAQLKYNTEKSRNELSVLYEHILRVTFCLNIGAGSVAPAIEEAIRNIENLNIKVKPMTEEKINIAKEMLRSSKRFNDYKRDLYIMLVGAYAEK